MARVNRIKRKAAETPVLLLAADEVQVAGIAAVTSELYRDLAREFWPGPLTIVLPAASTLPRAVAPGRSTVAVRVPATTSRSPSSMRSSALGTRTAEPPRSTLRFRSSTICTPVSAPMLSSRMVRPKYRGGGWISNETGLRVSNRVEYKADGLTDALGFRCCK